jgi:hypothetical protein
MDKRFFFMAGAFALVAVAACSDSGSDDGPSNAGAGAIGGTAGVGGGGTGGGGAGGVGGGGAGGVGGVGGVGGGGAGGVGGVGGVGGAAGTMGGSAGTSAGSAGTEAGSAGSAGTMAMGDGGVNDAASCIAAAAADGRTGACTECGCMKCLAEIMNCQDEPCQSVVTCGQAAGCSGSACYCGVDVDPIVCAISGASGPCMNEIATASGLVGTSDTCTANNACASDLSMLGDTDPDNPVQRARALSVCTQGQRASAGSPPLVEPTPEIMGMCETECATM